jgi:hypothetical protein
LISRIIAKVISNMVIESTAIGDHWRFGEFTYIGQPDNERGA